MEKLWSNDDHLYKNNGSRGIKMLDPELIIPPPECKDTWQFS